MSSEQLSKTEELFSAHHPHKNSPYSHHTTRETIPLSWVDDSSSNPSSEGRNVYRDTLSSILAPSKPILPPKGNLSSRHTSRDNTFEADASKAGKSKRIRSKQGAGSGNMAKQAHSKKGMKKAVVSSASIGDLNDSNTPHSKGARGRNSAKYAMMPCNRLYSERSNKEHAVQQAARELLADIVRSNQPTRLSSKVSTSKKGPTTLMKGN